MHSIGSVTYNISTISDTDNTSFPIAYIEVTGTATEPDYELTAFSPIRPHYLENLMDGYYEGSLPTQQYPVFDRAWSDTASDWTDHWDLVISGAWINQNTDAFDGETNWLRNISVNTINTWNLSNQGAEVHPVHVHVNHFQLLNSSLDALDSDQV